MTPLFLVIARSPTPSTQSPNPDFTVTSRPCASTVIPSVSVVTADSSDDTAASGESYVSFMIVRLTSFP